MQGFFKEAILAALFTAALIGAALALHFTHLLAPGR